MAGKRWANGVSVPIVTPFLNSDARPVDHQAFAMQVVRIAKAGLQVVVLGSNGEAAHLTNEERAEVIKTARRALDQNGFIDSPLLAGTGGGSAQTTIQLCCEAAQSGASHALVICPGYFAFAMGRDRAAIKHFFREVMDASPIPVMLYNFPGAAGGIDLDSDEINELALHPNCFGVKLTCAMVGKGQRIAAYTQSPEYLAKRGASLQACNASGRFLVLPGYAEYLLPAILARQHGCISGSGNLFPKTLKLLYDEALSGIDGDFHALSRAMQLQDRVAASDFILVKAGIAGTKYALDHFVEEGLGGMTRYPLGPVSEQIKEQIVDDLKEHWEFEQSL